MTKYETLLKVLPPLLEKLWPGSYRFSSFYHVDHKKVATFQIDVVAKKELEGYNHGSVFLTAEGKDLEEAANNLIKSFNKKCSDQYTLSLNEATEVEKKIKRAEEVMRSTYETVKENGFEIEAIYATMKKFDLENKPVKTNE